MRSDYQLVVKPLTLAPLVSKHLRENRFNCVWCRRPLGKNQNALIRLTCSKTSFHEAALIHVECYTPIATWVAEVWANVTVLEAVT